jgi:hypothetical protein
MNWIGGGLLAVLLLTYLHPYHGIRHDAILYLGQALLHVDPKNFGSDFFFAFGSQANFTIFPPLIAQLLRYFDAAGVFLVLTALGLLLFLVSSVALLVRLFPSPQWYWGLLALLILPTSYGGFSIISYAEPFFTGRSLAEPLVLLALAAYFWNRRALACGLALLAALLHPLQAIPLVLVLWCDLVYRDRRWLHLLWVPALILLAGMLGTPFADRLAMRYDAEWFSWFSEPNGFVYLTQWSRLDWAFLTTDIFLATRLLKSATGSLRTLTRSLLFATVLGLSISLILGDILHFVLPTSMQLWRIHWLLHWLAMASIPYLLHREYVGRPKDPIRTWLLLTTIVVGISSAGSSAPAVWILIPFYFVWPSVSHRISPAVRRLVAVSFPLILVILVVKRVSSTIIEFHQLGNIREVLRPEFVILAYPLIAAGLVTLAVLAFRHLGRWRPGLLILLIPALVYSASEWDRRSTWTRYIESAQYNPLLFGTSFEPKAQIFWAGELVAPWLILHRPSYFHSQQMGGMLFNRETAREAFVRRENLNLVEFQLSACRLMNELNKSEESCWLDASAITEVCQRSNGQLDYLILDNDLKQKSIGSWKIMGNIKGDRPITYHAYRCKDFLN